MLRTAALIALTAVQEQTLTGWARAATTPQRLARRARIILGSAAGLGSRRLAQQERMSRTTVQRWRARFVADGCDGMEDRPRRGRPRLLAPTTRALVVALACERPAERDVPLSRYSLSELAAEAATILRTEVGPSRSSIWRWLMHDALRPWRHQWWIFPRDPHFLELAGPLLDLYACRWHGQRVWADEYVLSADEKTSIQARRRLQPSLPPGPHKPRGSSMSTRVRAPCNTWRHGMFTARSCLVDASPRPARPPSVDSSTRSWTRSRIVRRAACFGSSTTAHHIAVNAQPKNSARAIHASWWSTRHCTRVGSIKSSNTSQSCSAKS
jgi:transposase